MSTTATTAFLLVSCMPALAAALGHRGHPLTRRSTPSQGFYDPRNGNGSWLTQVPDTFPAGLGEPINVVLSANSDAAVLVDQQTDGGLRNYFNAVGFSSECLGQHEGSDQAANLGDGHGYLNESAVIRWDYGNAALGTCEETVQGGNHFRYWVQDGPIADSGAIFMALSYEEPVADDHDIIFNGYNLARDWFVGNATNQTSLVLTSNVTNTSTYLGQVSFANYTYQTNVQYVSGFLPNTSNGINHFLTVGANGTNAVDGLVALIQVSIVKTPPASTSASRTPGPRYHLLIPLLILPLFLLSIPLS